MKFLPRALLLLLLATIAHSQAFPLFEPANGILVGQTTTFKTTAATSVTVADLFVSCGASTPYLNYLGNCQAGNAGTVTSVAFAVPTGFAISPIGSCTTACSFTLSYSGGIPITALAADSITVTAGTGLSGGGSPVLGGSTTLTNAGVTSLSAGAGISLSGSTGAVTVTNTVTAPTGANPTATVGTTAVNGVATTFMRSDGAPAINLGMVPIWTGQHSFTGGILVTPGSGSFYVTGTFTGTLTGMTATTTGTVTYSIVGSVATLRCSIDGTSNSTSMTMTGLPAILQPTQTQVLSSLVTNGGNFAFGGVQITAGSGTITFYATSSAIPAVSGFTASGTKGVLDWSITYALN